ncbi:TRAP transporter substrate-binding protein [Usitatibacter palustris]|uniref:Alpha-keto acid-binding periplasmic protein TakP n=1 Tax=Usitatibacter palustris TaxID=2732487 RepID=A0A6M4H5E7_9PROT|nr:TRAP transporter substrate-binding protein [Usitatibacter palustris]QJR14710.1 Alpha-keto acid-binding periplasmic protein TakP [Usitatibacter palustris]
MQRRKFLNATGAGMAGILAASSAPAIAQSQPEIKWRLASSFPKTLDTIFASADVVGKRVAAATNGKFQIQTFSSGEIVPGNQVLDAVQNGTVQCGHTASYYYVGKDPTFAFGTAVPFGLNCRQFNAWWYAGGGDALMNEFYADYNVRGILCGNTGAQMGGWYRKEIKSLADLKGLKMRIPGFGGMVLAKLGVVPQQIAGGEIYSALEKGSIDAVEWVGPYDDEKLGFNKIVKNYYYPGWWEGGPALHLFVNNKAWSELPKDYQAVLEAACHEGNTMMMARYDAGNPQALKRLVAAGVRPKAFPKDVMDACYKATLEIFAENCAKNPKFKKVHDHVMPFRNDLITWMRFTENTFDDFMAGAKK